MHIENYEWVLYLHGDLSEKRESEMDAHLANCDQCLAAYTKIMTGENIQPENKPLEKKSFWRLSARPSSMRWAALAAMVFIMFIGVSFTPTGKIVLANFWVTLEKFGDSLSGLFGVSNDDGLIETVNQTIVSKDGIEIKVDQVFVESDRIYISLFIASDLLTHQLSLQPGNMEFYANNDKNLINMDWGISRFIPRGEEGNELPVQMIVLYASPLKDYSHEKYLSLHLNIKDLFYQLDDYKKGPWIFDFDVDVQPLAEKTRIVPLSEMIHEKANNYQALQLIISPIRTRITVQRLNPPEYGRWVDKNGVNRISYGTSTNLRGFLIRDFQGNEVEITGGNLRWFDYTEKNEVRYDYYSSPEVNPYQWLESAENIEMIPYVSSLNRKSDQSGLKKFTPLERDSFIVPLMEGQENEK